eukprot:TRINITY_DN5554_c0_g1_i1.p1 TRINITY_DN5554_c0_g1~~TRINITY_DN5554_c0_g1_i1.p1  ORF type:complete len:110 (-),score=45.47 TRINITY_DN5554_c0_g1_i1:62-391(-)
MCIRDRDLGDLFGVLTAIDRLDHSYTRGAISAQEYTPACSTLLGQYKSISIAMSMSDANVTAFMDEYRMDCKMARKRITIGVPVSYTHLRAHETVLDLVCRLLLEKKKI